jgi:hypothetical protein
MTADEAIKAVAQHEEMHKMSIPEPTTQDILNNIHLPNPDAIQYTHGGTLGAPEPQPTLTDVINNICTQLQLLTTIISQPKAQPEEGTNVPTLQECVALTLQQADWFKDVVRQELVALDIVPIAQDAVESVVEHEVESYFENNFDPTYHFDFDDAVNDAVNDRIDDAVEAHMNDAVESYMSNATITISK